MKTGNINYAELHNNAFALATRMDNLLCETALFGYEPRDNRLEQLEELADSLVEYTIISLIVEQFDDMAADNHDISDAWKDLKSDLLAFAKSAVA